MQLAIRGSGRAIVVHSWRPRAEEGAKVPTEQSAVYEVDRHEMPGRVRCIDALEVVALEVASPRPAALVHLRGTVLHALKEVGVGSPRL